MSSAKLVIPMPVDLSLPIRLIGSILYRVTGRRAWTPFYKIYRHVHIKKILQDESLLARFRDNQDLPKHYGYRLDERVIEYPWVFSRLSHGPGILLDAGSVLNRAYLMAHSYVREKNTIIFTLAPERQIVSSAQVSYLYGDLRSTVLANDVFDEIVCISTIEHIGLDNTQIYTSDNQYSEQQTEDYLLAVDEMVRLLKPGGSLLLTVPYGKYQNIGWLQQFDATMLDKILSRTEQHLHVTDQVFYKFSDQTWNIATQAECDDSEYYDVHSDPQPPADFATAARAVACIAFQKKV